VEHQKTHSSIFIDSDVATIMDVIADVQAYPDWIPGIDRVVLEAVFDEDERPASATFYAQMSGMRGFYTVDYDWADSEVTWYLTAGDFLRDLHGIYTCTPVEGGVEVDYGLEMILSVPVVGALRRRGEKVVVNSALKGLKKRVENG
jgi:ribosome-associated toxin RatA of RatAB toxin-antitoxin module